MLKLLTIFGFVVITTFTFCNQPRTMNTDEKIADLSTDDPSLQRYKDTAQEQLPYLIEFMREHEKGDTLFRYAVKSEFREGENSEHMWVEVYDYQDNYFLGRLTNEPSTLKQLRYRDTVRVNKSEVEDWILQDFLTNTEVGGFSRNYIRNKAK